MWIYFYPSWVETELKNAYIGEYHEFNGDLSKAISSNRTSFTPTRDWAVLYKIQFNENGTNMYITDGAMSNGEWQIQKWELSIPRDITTASNRTDYWLWVFGPYLSHFFANNWNILFACWTPWYSNMPLYKYTLNWPYDLSDLTNRTNFWWDMSVQSISEDWKTFIFQPSSARSVLSSVSSTARTPNMTTTTILSSSNVIEATFCNDGKNLMAIDGWNLKKYELWTAYDLTSLNTTPVQTQSTGLSGNPRWIYVDRYGDNIYLNVNNVIYRYNLV